MPTRTDLSTASFQPALRLKSSTTEARSSGASKPGDVRTLAPVDTFQASKSAGGSPAKSGATVIEGLKSSFSPAAKPETEKEKVNLRSRVSDLNSTSTSLNSSEQRIADRGNQIDV